MKPKNLFAAANAVILDVSQGGAQAPCTINDPGEAHRISYW